jgi:peptide/nickel transport system substrate-binding protein
MGRGTTGFPLLISKAMLPVALALAVAALAGCSGAASGAKPSSSSGGNLTIVVTTPWSSLDPVVPTTPPPALKMLPVYNSLFNANPNGTSSPELATGYTVSKNGETVDITLRHDVKFQDGTAFNAQAVVYNLDRYMNPKNGSVCLTPLAPITNVTAVGTYTVQLSLAYRDDGLMSAFSANVCGLMVSPAAVQKYGSSYGQHPVGTGPFKYVSGSTGVVARFTRWNGYWGGKPSLSSVTIETVANDSGGLDAVQANTAQVWAEITDPGSASELVQAKSDPSLTVESGPAGQYEFVGFNMMKAPFNSLAARQAVTYATNTAAIAKSLYSNLFPTFEGFFPATTLGYENSVPGYPSYNLARAKSLVSSLGGSLSFALLIPNTNEGETLGDALKAQWALAGINVTLDPLSTPEQIGDQLDHDLQATMTLSPPESDPDALAEIWLYSKSTSNITGYSNPSADDLLAAGRTALTTAQRRSDYQELTALATQAVPFDDLSQLTPYSVVSKKVSGWVATSFGAEPYQSISLAS